MTLQFPPGSLLALAVTAAWGVGYVAAWPRPVAALAAAGAAATLFFLRRETNLP